MGRVFFMSDPHLGHESMAKMRGFSSADKMFQHLKAKWNSVVHKKDVVKLLGDITMEKKRFYPLLDELNGMKHVVLGNHDRPQDVPELLKHVQHVSGTVNYKRNYVLTHCPIHEKELYRFSYNIHGHVHENTIKVKEWCPIEGADVYKSHPRYINVSAEVLDYTPRTLEELVHMKLNKLL